MRNQSLRTLLVLAGLAIAAGGCGKEKPSTPGGGATSGGTGESGSTESGGGEESGLYSTVPLGTNHIDGFDRDLLHYTHQGSGFFPLNILRALNDSKTGRPYLENLERFGLLPGEKSERNPEGFPVGIVTNTVNVGDHEIELFGFTCAACHTSDIFYDGKVVRVDGGSGLFYVDELGDQIANSLKATFEDPEELFAFLRRLREHSDVADSLLAKFERLGDLEKDSEAGKLLVEHIRGRVAALKARIEDPESDAKAAFALGKDALQAVAKKLAAARTKADTLFKDVGDVESALMDSLSGLEDTLANLHYRLNFLKIRGFLAKPGNRLAAGYGRADDFGTARVELFAGWSKKNMLPVNAPVSTPSMWNIQKYAWLHWNANTNSVIQRSMGESIGVGATYNAETLDTSVAIVNQMHMEQQLYKLTPPAWPEDVFGAIDQEKADRGKELYAEHCAKCHDPAGVDDKGLIVFNLFTIEEAGTDPNDSNNFDRPVIKADGSEVSFAAAIAGLLEALQEKAKTKMSPEDQQLMDELEADRRPVKWRDTATVTGGPVYPAKPLEGIWSTAPYLHNGSVPSLYHLLQKADDRPKTFLVGQKDFDPVHVGFELDSDKITSQDGLELFELDTSEPGNLNTGHEWGWDLSDEDKFALIEYLKIHKDPQPVTND